MSPVKMSIVLSSLSSNADALNLSFLEVVAIHNSQVVINLIYNK